LEAAGESDEMSIGEIQVAVVGGWSAVIPEMVTRRRPELARAAGLRPEGPGTAQRRPGEGAGTALSWRLRLLCPRRRTLGSCQFPRFQVWGPWPR
jgi:hypothetical protein